MIIVSIFLIVNRKITGLQLAGSPFALFDFVIGMTFPFFSSWGYFPFLAVLLRMLAIPLLISMPPYFISYGVIRSHPPLLLFFIDMTARCISSSVNGVLISVGCISAMGLQFLLWKMPWKSSVKISAQSFGFDVSTSLLWIVSFSLGFSLLKSWLLHTFCWSRRVFFLIFLFLDLNFPFLLFLFQNGPIPRPYPKWPQPERTHIRFFIAWTWQIGLFWQDKT